MDTLTVKELRGLAKNPPGKKRKSDYLRLIGNEDPSFEALFTNKGFIPLFQIGNEGKEGKVYMTMDRNTLQKYAMKVFRKSKSPKTIRREAYLQFLAYPLSPRIIEVNLEEKYIVMELLEETLVDVLSRQSFTLTRDQQREILHLFDGLDEKGITSGDANPCNLMYRNGKLYTVDFGFGKMTASDEFKKMKDEDGIPRPNALLMTTGLLIALKRYNNPEKFQVLLNAVPDILKGDVFDG